MKQTKLTRPRCDRRGQTVTINSIFRALSEHTDQPPSCWQILDGATFQQVICLWFQYFVSNLEPWALHGVQA